MWVCVLVTQLGPTFSDTVNCSPSGSSVHGVFQTRRLEWLTICFSLGSSQTRDQTWVSCIAVRFFTNWATGKVLWCIIKYVSKVAQSCLTLCDPMDFSVPGSSVHGILQTRILEWVAISFSRGSSWPRDWIRVSSIADRRSTIWATSIYYIIS